MEYVQPKPIHIDSDDEMEVENVHDEHMENVDVGRSENV